MTVPLDLRGRWVFLTGASSGLGTEMARVLAASQGANLVLVARRRDRLEALAAELTKAHGTECHVIAADLAKSDECDRAFAEAVEGRQIHAAVLNAGVTYFGQHLEMSDTDFEQMLALNVASIVRMSRRFVPHLASATGGGALMLVSSMAGFSPLPFQAAYCGTKAFVTNFGQAFAQEIASTGVSVTVFAPGGIATEMSEKSGLSKKFKPGSMEMMMADVCASLAVDSLVKRRSVAIPGALNKALSVITSVLPRTFIAKRTAAIYRGAL